MEEIQQEEKKHNGNDIFHIKEKIYEMILYGNPQLKDLDIEVDVLRNLLRLAKDPNLYPNQKPCLDFHTWEVWMRKVDEIGRMIGGYSEWVNSREKQK